MRLMVLCILAIALLFFGCAPRRVVVVDPIPGGVEVVKVNTAPPPPPAVRIVKPRRPGPRHHWVPGHYRWQNGRYVWKKGHWSVPRRRGAVWVPGRFDVTRGVWVRPRWR